jgi:HSP90 family molecular chaperone
MGYMMGKKILEINPSNPIIKRLKMKLDSDSSESNLKDLVHLLYDVTLQSSGFILEDPSMFSNRILKLIQLGMGVEEEEEDHKKVEVIVDHADHTMEEVD